MNGRSPTLLVGLLVLVAAMTLAAQHALHPQGPGLVPGVPATTLAANIHPSDTVNLDSANFGNGTNPSFTIEGGASVELLTVPPDKWFVLTNWKGETGGIQLLEDSAGTLTSKHSSLGQASYEWTPAGLVFAPGSKVVLRNTDANYAHSCAFVASGYLVDA